MTGPLGTKTHTYAYDGTWKDKLISYDGKGITYDAKTGEIYLESKDGKIQIPTGLKHIP